MSQSHSKSSSCSLDECRLSANPPTKPNDLACESTGRLLPSTSTIAFVSIIQPETHTHTHPLTALFPGLPRWATTRKVKPIWILLKQVTVSGQPTASKHWRVIQPESWHYTVPRMVESCVDLGTAVRVHSPCPRLCIAIAVMINTNTETSQVRLEPGSCHSAVGCPNC